MKDITKPKAISNGRNLFLEIRESVQDQNPISGSNAIYEYMKDLEVLDREAVYVIHLDAHLKILARELISLGTLTSSIVVPR